MPSFLIITYDENAEAPPGSAINRVIADTAFEIGRDLLMVPDDGRSLWERPPPPDMPGGVPQSVSNSDMRIVLQGHFLEDGRSLFTAIQTMLSGARDQTAPLPDSDPRKRQALASWTRWDMGNFFLRAEPMIAGIRDAFGFTDEQVDALFIEAGLL